MLDFEKEFNPDLFLPVYKPEVDVKSKLCARAHKILKESMRKFDAHLMVEGLKLYDEAYISGVQEAAVNALAFCVSIAIRFLLAKRHKVSILEDLIDLYAGRLCSTNHPVGWYYLALSAIYGFYEREGPKDESMSDSEVGWSLMLDLAQRPNVYAENFVNFSVEFFYETVDLPVRKPMLVLPPPIQAWGSLIYKVWE